MNLENVTKKPNTNPGITGTVYVACRSLIDVFPGLTTVGTAAEQLIVITDDITFTVVTDGFVKIDALLPKKSDWTSTLEGDRGSKSELNTLNIILAGTDIEIRAFRKLC